MDAMSSGEKEPLVKRGRIGIAPKPKNKRAYHIVAGAGKRGALLSRDRARRAHPERKVPTRPGYDWPRMSSGLAAVSLNLEGET